MVRTSLLFLVPLTATINTNINTNAFILRPSNTIPLTLIVPSRQTMALSMDAGGLSEVLQDAWSSYNVALEEDPLITKSVTAGIILGMADLAGQALERSLQPTPSPTSTTTDDASVDFYRVLRFATFGLVLQAPWNHFYYLTLDSVLPPTPDPLTLTTLTKVTIDQFLQAPIFTVVIFYFLGLAEGKSMEDVRGQLGRDYKDTMVANWKLWVPATAVNIAFCPPALRVLFLNCVFFFWSIFLSLKLNGDGDGDGEGVVAMGEEEAMVEKGK